MYGQRERVMATTKRKFIKVGKADRVIVKAGPNSNKIHIEVTLTRDQEVRLLKMLQERHPKLRF
jgi:hypothetical protein